MAHVGVHVSVVVALVGIRALTHGGRRAVAPPGKRVVTPVATSAVAHDGMRIRIGRVRDNEGPGCCVHEWIH